MRGFEEQGRLVAPQVKSPDYQRAAAEAFRRPFVDVQLSVKTGGFAGFQEEELCAEQPDTAETMLAHVFDLLGEADVSKQGNADPVLRHAWQRLAGRSGACGAVKLPLQLRETCNFRRGRVDQHLTRTPIHEQTHAGLDVRRYVGNARHGGDPERTREYGRMAILASLFGHDRDRTGPGKLDSLRGQEFACDYRRASRQRLGRPRRAAGQVPEHPTTHVADVLFPLTGTGMLELAQTPGEVLDHGLQRLLHIHLLLAYVFLNLPSHFAYQHRMGREDRGRVAGSRSGARECLGPF